MGCYVAVHLRGAKLDHVPWRMHMTEKFLFRSENIFGSFLDTQSMLLASPFRRGNRTNIECHY